MDQKLRFVHKLGLAAGLLILGFRLATPYLEDETAGIYIQGIGIVILGAAVLIETGIRYDARLEAEDEEEPNEEKSEDEERPNDEKTDQNKDISLELHDENNTDKMA
ncbi:MAG: hypothetical protein ACLTPC_03045 [Lacrimispora saccharolytica]